MPNDTVVRKLHIQDGIRMTASDIAGKLGARRCGCRWRRSQSLTARIESLLEDEVDPRRILGTKGKIVGAKSLLRPKHAWSIRTKLQGEGQLRSRARFNRAIEVISVALNAMVRRSQNR